MTARSLLAAPALAALLAAPFAAPPLAARQGSGSTGAAVLQLPAGSRAAALSGAYTAIAGDADALFYNPAGVAGLDLGASLAYQQYVEGISLGSAAGAVRISRVVLGFATAYFDAGEVAVIEPDPVFGGQRGRETGEFAGARESASRISLALPLGPLSIGMASGFLTSDLAGVERSAFLFDLGAQYSLSRVRLGAALRNLGGSAVGDDGAAIRLPTEARLGAAFETDAPAGLGLLVGADLASNLRAGTTNLAFGAEGGLVPRPDRRVSAVGRVGIESEGQGDDGLGTLRLGAGVALDRLAIDYTYQQLDFFGTVHRIGLRWSRPAR